MASEMRIAWKIWLAVICYLLLTITIGAALELEQLTRVSILLISFTAFSAIFISLCGGEQ